MESRLADDLLLERGPEREREHRPEARHRRHARSSPIPDSTISEFQPSISPDGTKICFTLGTGLNGTADVFTADLATPASQTNLSDNVGTMPQHGDYNCTWSPDGTLIAYVMGTFTVGALVMERSDDTSPSAITLEDNANNFDGNPDWRARRTADLPGRDGQRERQRLRHHPADLLRLGAGIRADHPDGRHPGRRRAADAG